MSDSIELFEPEGFILNDLRPPNVTSRPRKSRRINKKAVAVYQCASKRFATASVEIAFANKSMGLRSDIDPSHRLSLRLDDEKGPSCVPSRLNNFLSNRSRSLFSKKD